MLIEPLIQQLHQLRLTGMAAGLEQQLSFPDLAGRSFEDRLGIMIQHEFTERATHRLAQRLRWAKLPMPACIEDLDTRSPRGLDAAQLQLVDEKVINQGVRVTVRPGESTTVTLKVTPVGLY